MKSVQRGFTLIELIVVIVILGILAATALPKFVDLGGDARTSAMTAVEGSLRAANGMIYAKAAAANKLTQTSTEQISYGGGSIGVLAGFAATASDLKFGMDLSTNDFELSGEVFQHKKAPNKPGCSVTYAAASLSNSYIPQYTLSTAGCSN